MGLLEKYEFQISWDLFLVDSQSFVVINCHSVVIQLSIKKKVKRKYYSLVKIFPIFTSLLLGLATLLEDIS